MPMPGPMTPRAARPAPMCSMSSSSSSSRDLRPVSLGPWSALGPSVSRLQRAVGSLGRWARRTRAAWAPPRGGPRSRARVNMRVRTLKMSAWTKLSRTSRPTSATGMMAIVSAVMTPSATSPPKMLPKSRIDSVRGLTNSSRSSIRPTNRAMTPRAEPVPELPEREELGQVAADAEVPEALDVEDREADQGKADRDVHVARRRAKELDLADRRDQAAPVGEQDVQEEGREERDVAGRPAGRRARSRSPGGPRTRTRRRSGRRPGIVTHAAAWRGHHERGRRP